MKRKYPSTIILLGRSGSGKDTQVRLFEKETGFRTFITGERLRAIAGEPSVLGRELQSELQQGKLAPTWLVSFLWIRELTGLKPTNGLIFNGSPRKLSEAELLDEVLMWVGRGTPFVILVDVSAKEAMERLTKRRICTGCGAIIPYIGEFKSLAQCNRCGGALKTRSDDVPSAIRTRFAWFDKEVGPVIRYYELKGNLHRVNGEQSIEAVWNDIVKVLHRASNVS